MSSISAKDVYSKSFESVHESDTLSHCLSKFNEEMPPVLAVLDEKDRLKGVIARRWIIRSRLDPSTTKVKKLMRPVPAVQLYDSISEAARLMIGSEIRQLPVYSGEKLAGFITDEDVIHGAIRGEWGNTKAEEIMTEYLFTIEQSESVGALLSLFREHGISHAPVIDDGKLVGIVSVHDIIEHIFQPRRRETLGERVGEKVPTLTIPVKGIMSKPVITIAPETSLRAAEDKMHKHDISSVIVVRKERPVGIVTKRDFLEPVAQMKLQRQRLTVQFSAKDLEIDEIQKGFLMDAFDSFARKFEQALETGTLFVYLKTHGTNHKGRTLVHCRLQLRSPKGFFAATGEGWDVEQTFSTALERLERQVMKIKEFDVEFARSYLQRIRFPSSEL